jgi:butyrate kinase
MVLIYRERNVEVCEQAVTRTGKNFRSNSTIEKSIARFSIETCIFLAGTKGKGAKVSLAAGPSQELGKGREGSRNAVHSTWWKWLSVFSVDVLPRGGGEEFLLVQEKSRVLAINPGATSTKFGIHTQAGAEWEQTIRHGDEEIDRFGGGPMLARLEYRGELIEQALAEAGYAEQRFAAVVGRGGLLPPLPCGTYLVDEAMAEELRLARRGQHASNLGGLLALRFAQASGVGAYIVDPVTVDEWQECARPSGSPLVERTAIGHALNTKAVARRYARELGRAYPELRLIVAHLGSGITVSAHRDGRMIDSNSIEEGPFGVDRTGGLPVRALARLSISGQFSAAQLDRHLFGGGGLSAYLGTRDLMEVERRIDAGDSKAALILDAMLYQVGKEAGAMSAVLQGKVDAVLLTGGMAYAERVVRQLRGYLEWIAPVRVYPGEDELRALAEGAFRVLNGEEPVRRLER